MLNKIKLKLKDYIITVNARTGFKVAPGGNDSPNAKEQKVLKHEKSSCVEAPRKSKKN